MTSTERKHALASIFLTLVLDVLGFSLVLPFLGDEARVSFGSAPVVGTLLTASFAAAQFVFTPLWGRLSDRVGRRPVLVWSVAASVIGFVGLGCALAYAHSVAWLFAARIFSGVATANLGVASTYIADVTKPEERARGMGLIGVAFGVGFLVGPVIGGALADFTIAGRHGPLACFAAAGFAALNCLWVMVKLRESVSREALADRKPITLNPLHLDDARRAFGTPGLGAALMLNLVVMASFLSIDTTMRYFTADLFSMTNGQTGWVLASIGAADGLCQGVLIRILTRRGVGELTLLRIGIFVLVLGFAFLSCSPTFGVRALFGASLIMGFGSGFFHPGLWAYISKKALPGQQGATMGVAHAVTSAAQISGPLVGGFLYGAVDPRAPYGVATIGMCVAFVLAMTMQSDRRPITSAAPRVAG